jgi:uncharacterized membrane protein YgdD (TMEM256/DUF423 family)
LNPKHWICIGALVGFLSVGAGAFGAHAMKDTRLEKAFYFGADDEPESVALGEYRRRIDIFEVAVRYQMFHALALVLTGLVGWAHREPSISASAAGVCFTFGVVFFCAPLYGMVFLMGFEWLGAIVPIGGVAMLVGWFALALAGLGLVRDEEPSSPSSAPAA